MIKRLSLLLAAVILQMVFLLFARPAFGQQTLGGLTGVVSQADVTAAGLS